MLESQLGDRVYRKVVGAPASPKQIDDVIQELDGHLPDKRSSVYEGDWGQSAVKWNGADVVRVAQGQVDQQNNPVNGQAYWFNRKGLPVQTVDATPSNQLIRQYFPKRIVLYGKTQSEPKQGSALLESTLANEIGFVDS